MPARSLLLLMGLLAAAGEAHAACASPVGSAGDVRYASNFGTLAFCNGTDWISTAGWGTSGSGGATLLNELTDVDTTGAASGKILSYNGSTWVVSDSTVTDARIGTLTAGKWCTSNGTIISCTVDAPLTVTTTLNDLSDVDTTGAATGNVLAFNGSTWVVSDSAAAGVTSAASSTGAIQFNSGNALAGDTSNLFWDDANNRLGIGTSTPGTKLQVDGGIVRISATSYPRLEHSISSTLTWSTGPRTGGDYYIYRESGSGNVLVPFGNVGIGTSFPDKTLSVAGVISATSSVNLSWQGTVTASNTAPASTVGILGGQVNGAYWVGVAGRSSQGANGVGVYGEGGSTTAVGGYFTNTSTGPALVTGNGNVGIGASVPRAKLDVVGTISATDAIQVGGSSLACSSGIPGTIRYSGGNVQYCNGSSWTSLSSNTTAPAVDGTGSANHVAYWSDANTLTYDNSQLYWDASNNWLGIGTNAPSQALTISGTSATPALAWINTFSNSYGQFVASQPGTGSGWLGLIGTNAGLGARNGTVEVGASGSLDLVLLTNATERVRIDGSTGYVGIGTQSPTATLQVSGSFIVSTSAQTTTPSLFVATSGGVGIGTTSPQSHAAYGWLTANGSGGGILSLAANNTEKFRVQYNGAATYLNALTAEPLILNTSATERVRVDVSGNVGIGTASPAGKLHISGDAGSSWLNSSAWFTNTGTGARSYSMGPRTDGRFYIGDETAGVSRISLDSTGNVGIGTNTPSAKLEVAGHQELSGATSNTLSFGTTGVAAPGAGSAGMKLQLYGATPNTMAGGDYALGIESGTMWFNSGGAYKWYVGSIQKMTMDSSGNVGIGTTSPGQKLDVNGKGRFGDITNGSVALGSDGNAHMELREMDDAGTPYIDFINDSSTDYDARVRLTGDDTLVFEGATTLNLNGVNSFNVFGATAATVIKADSSAASSNASLQLVNPDRNWSIGNNGSTYGGALIVYDNTAGATRVLIDSAGDFGVGVTNPTYKIHASGQVAGAGAYVNTSDGRLKKDVNELDYGLSTIMKLRPVSFRWKEQREDWQKGRHLGLIAQEAEKVVPEVVSTAHDDVGTKSIAYGDLTPVLIKAAQELKAANDNLISRTETLRIQLKAANDNSAILERRLKVMEEKVRALSR